MVEFRRITLGRVDLDAISGDVVLGSAASAATTVLGQDLVATQSLGASVGLNAFPASLGVTALNGNIDFGPGIGVNGAIALFPSARGQLDLLAAQNIDDAVVTMSDAVAGSYPSVATPRSISVVKTAAFTAYVFIRNLNRLVPAKAL